MLGIPSGLRMKFFVQASSAALPSFSSSSLASFPQEESKASSASKRVLNRRV